MKNKRRFGVTAMALALSAGGCLSAPATKPNPDIPVKPILSTQAYGWTNVFKLSNPSLKVVVVPDTGRIAVIQPVDGENLLRMDDWAMGKLPPEDQEDQWYNFGGDWIWPTSQTNWASIIGRNWPPPRMIDGEKWAGRSWVNAIGSQCCKLTKEYGAPLNIRATRLIKVPRKGRMVIVKQRIERTAPSDIPITLWNISQLTQPDRVYIPANARSEHPNGVRPMMFDTPGSNVLSVCGGNIIYTIADGGEHKLCADSPRQWIAAKRNNTLIIEQASGDNDGTYPDGGCSLEMYSNSSLGYTEIETLSVERVLAPGESMENVLTIWIEPFPSELKDCDVARWIEERISDPGRGKPVGL